MAKRVKPTPEQLTEIERRVKAGEPYTKVADWLGCCTDTLRRIMHRAGIATFQGAKYQVKRHYHLKHWNRPCLICKCAKRRPKNQYICDKCKAAQTRQQLTGRLDDTIFSISLEGY